MISFYVGDILLAAKEIAPPNTVPLASIRGKRPISFKKVKVVKKVASSPRPSSTTELPLRPTPTANFSPHSSPIAADPSPSSFSPPDVANAGFELARIADYLGEENNYLKLLLRKQLHWRRNWLRDAAVAKASSATQEVKRLEGEVKRLEDDTSQHPKKLWAAVENFKQSTEFEGALYAAVERFKKSQEFLDAMGANAAYGMWSFIIKYKEKYLGLHSDYEEFQEGYNSSWFVELSLNAPSEDEEEEAPPASEVDP
ncbi:hypothetical protein LIER_40340 [Lithospermum erythrorhizon]|uniref:Uncharacterized protein n=1 Tax=Lithospermum erythrorhizon TaxID=34254 RepID=A0AAV3QU82_LITER